MIADKIENLSHYSQFEKYSEKISSFIANLSDETPAGRHELMGDDLFALVQRYYSKPKTDSCMESHFIYADLQYISKGREIIYWDISDELIVDPAKASSGDIAFYMVQPDKGSILLSSGMFGYYAPTDAHMPCIMVDRPEQVEKVVFKIKVK